MIWIAGYLAIGATISTYEYATAPQWLEEPKRAGWIGFVAMTLLWPLALVPWERLGLD
jgi:hypothetical protein